MAIEFRLPELGEGVTEGTVSQILVSEGDEVREGQGIVELESDKAVAEIPSSVSGKVVEVRVEEGQTIRVGDVILVLEAAAQSPKGESEDKSAAEAPPEKKTPEKKVVRDSDDAGRKKGGARSPRVEAEEAKPARGEAGSRRPAPDKKIAVLASPTVRRLARELDVDLDEVPVSDPSGRVTSEEVRRFAEGDAEASPQSAPAEPAPARKADAPPRGESAAGKWGTERREPMSQIRKKTAERMARNWSGIPHVTHHDKADITEIETMRQKYGRQVEKAGGKLTVTAVLVKVVAEALRRFPQFNASVDMEDQEVVYKEYRNIGVAVDTPNGLLVPVIRDADTKSLTELCVELPALAAKARDRKLSIEDMQGGTFTISNLGGIGGTAFTPIINGPEVSILGVSRSRIEPVHINGQFAPRLMMPLSLSYDHRIIDGAQAARFTRWVAEAIEQPWILFLEDA